VIFEAGHFISKEDIIRETFIWLDKYFGPVEKK